MSCDFDYTIVGGGCIGASILFELVRRRSGNVLLIDQGRKTVSATAHSGGMLRVFHERVEHIHLALGHQSRLQQLGLSEARSGSLYFFNKKRYADYQPNFAILTKAQYPFEILNVKTGRARYPQFHWASEDYAIYEPLGGQMSPTQFSQRLMTVSQNLGATLLDNFEVFRFCRYRDRFRLSGLDSTVTTKHLILAGGARLIPRLRDLGLTLPLEARPITVFTAAQVGASLPNYFDRESLDFACLGRGDHVTLASESPSRLVGRHWEGPFTQSTGFDCYSPHRLGFLGQVAGHPGLSIATGWGGTGFKFSLEVGHRVVTALEPAHLERGQINAHI